MRMKMVGAVVVIGLSSEACTTYSSLGAIPAPTSETIRLSLTDAGHAQILGPLPGHAAIGRL